MRSQEIRQSFVDFFVERGHRAVASAPLVPHGDPTLLFTNAGMVQFKDAFLGDAEPPASRAVSVQKCLRVSGKHNDLENVGPSPRHHTFFEMLGNFSFGDYFKAEAIEFGWDLVTRVWGLPADLLSASVYENDEEAAELWTKVTGLPPERVHRCGEKDNFWAMGETGPCGPCSEIFVDTRPDLEPVDWHEGSESGRYLEIWNLVFMQFSRNDSGELEPLPNPSIDTGAGLERIAAVLQGVESNYDSDLFRPVIDAAAELAGHRYGVDSLRDVSFRVVADHLRSVAFLLADGVIPGNEGRGYVLRRILRRAVRHGMRVGFEEPFLHRLVPVLGEVMGIQYRELGETEAASVESVRAEEEKFLSTVALASRQVQEAIDTARGEGSQALPGDVVFRFYDTYGLPVELIEEIAEEEQFQVDRDGFEVALGEQRQRSRSSGAGSQRRLRRIADELSAARVVPTAFEGYGRLQVEGVTAVLLLAFEGDHASAVDGLERGQEGIVVLDRTPFYAEAGGQIGDRGNLAWEGGMAEVVDTQKTATGVTLHQVRVESGTLKAGFGVTATVAREHRAPTERNHTATHLLHAALRRVLGDQVRQAGSLVAPERLRFDFTYAHPMDGEQIAAVEKLVNRWVLAAETTDIVSDRPFQEALDAGAMALFGEKYGDTVRTVRVPALSLDDQDDLASLELCGGCHVRNTGEIGPFLIVSERGVASGVRRIEALTGEGALERLGAYRSALEETAEKLNVVPDRVSPEIDRLSGQIRALEDELSDLRLKAATGQASEEEPQDVDGVRVLTREVPPAPAGELRTMTDVLRARLGSGVVVLGARADEKVTLIVGVTDDLSDRVHAGRLARSIAEIVDGSGGGRSDFAQAGGRDPEKLGAALDAVAAAVRDQIGARD
jgi:alanyl-tRNA synthetase